MVEETKVAEAPVVEQPKATGDEKLIDNRRQEVEKLVAAENANIPERETEEAPEAEKPKVETEEKPKEEDPLDRIKKSVQRRIDKVVAQKKTVEEELAEAKAELERLRNAPKQPEPEQTKDAPLTVEQIEAYIVKMREEGNTKEEIAATRFLIKFEKEQAIKEFREAEEKKQREANEATQRTNLRMKELANDYVVYDASGNPDPKNDLTLANQNGLLYKTALSLYNDKELHADFYNDPDVINGFRRAVADAYREIHQQGLIKAPKGDLTEIPRNPRQVLADPDAELVEETTSRNTNSLSDAEKVREEIKARKKNRFIRKPSNN